MKSLLKRDDCVADTGRIGYCVGDCEENPSGVDPPRQHSNEFSRVSCG